MVDRDLAARTSIPCGERSFASNLEGLWEQSESSPQPTAWAELLGEEVLDVLPITGDVDA